MSVGEKMEYGKFGQMRLRYLKEEKRDYYTLLLTQGQLAEHLNQVNREAFDE
jgi:hypothetical protein